MTPHAHTDDAARDRAAITAALERLTDAWNAGDAAAYGAQFTEDAGYVAYDGSTMNGRAEIEHVHRVLFEGPLRGSRLEGSGAGDAPPRFIRPGVAVLQHGGGARPDGAAELADDRLSVATLVLVEEGPGDWRIAAFHNTRRRPAPNGPGEEG
ncbi:SgcJ/EcaC family oxidoreductase [Nocardiopsis composta]|uniref:Uncharacterized protein (TIGR02246 family) n=1 Tax=Nocardiopsis composta TaxID=157465 RepID=A0A7W8QGW7_9ACTN|nr:SgcJ/EcaC family oxidoreductase [Nocardiopsis composta]MBB5430267.1 uncharacterized protein (TIGR02246 family) [Nocardiopsis composta]